MSKDYYKILGVEKTATEDDVKKAYRKLAHQYHPDHSGGDEKKFKEINEAYQVLSNKEKRTQYDRYGSNFDGAQGHGGGNPFGGFGFGEGQGFGFGFDPGSMGDMGNLSDVFDAMFEGLGGKRRRTYARGGDLELVHELTLEDAYAGKKTSVKFKTAVSCTHCSGVGHFPDAGFTPCESCDGRGEVRESRSTFFGNFSKVRPCTKCAGVGKIPKKQCVACSGTGRMIGDRNIDVLFSAGIHDSQIIKVPGAGEAGDRGATAGDLYIHVRIKPHKIFERRDDDLVMKQEVSLLDLLLEKPMIVSTLGGKKITLNIPEHVSIKNPIKIAGEGMPKFGSYSKGNLYVELDVKTPNKLTPAQKKTLEDLF